MTPCTKCKSYDAKKLRVALDRDTGEILYSMYRCNICGTEYKSGDEPIVYNKEKWYKTLWGYTKFAFGVAWFGGRTYVRLKYGFDPGPLPTKKNSVTVNTAAALPGDPNNASL